MEVCAWPPAVLAGPALAIVSPAFAASILDSTRSQCVRRSKVRKQERMAEQWLHARTYTARACQSTAHKGTFKLSAKYGRHVCSHLRQAECI